MYQYMSEQICEWLTKQCKHLVGKDFSNIIIVAQKHWFKGGSHHAEPHRAAFV